MKLKSTLILLIVFPLLINAQNITPQDGYTFFSTAERDDYKCGGKMINAQLYSVTKIPYTFGYITTTNITAYEEDNKFFLQISEVGNSNTITIYPIKTNIGYSGNALFELPENLKVGAKYQIKMGSTNPSILSQNSTFIEYGVGKLPFTVDFTQETAYYKNAPQVKLKLPLKFKNGITSTNYLQTIRTKLSDGSIFESKVTSVPSIVEIPILPQDSINIYKISEISNSCGVQGEAVGQAKVVNKIALDQFIIKNDYNICKDVSFAINITSNFIQPNTPLKIEFSKSSEFKSLTGSVNSTLGANNQVIVAFPSFLRENESYGIRIIDEKSNSISNVSGISVSTKTNTVSPHILTFNDKQIQISFPQYIDGNKNSAYYLPLKELIINNRNIIPNELVSASNITVPMPIKDTTLVFNKITTACGVLESLRPELLIKPSNYQYIELKTSSTSVCEGNTVDYTLKLPPNITMNDIRFRVFTEITYQEYLPNSGVALNPNRNLVNLDEIKSVNVDATNKSISIKVPTNLNDQINKVVGTKRVAIKKVQLSVIPLSNIPNVLISQNFISPTILLTPKISFMTLMFLTGNGANLENIPITYRGGYPISYTLSNGLKGQINQEQFECQSDCDPLLGGVQSIKMILDKSTTIKIESIKNSCATVNPTDKVDVLVINPDKPKLVIDATNLPSKACRGTETEIPFTFYGNWNNTSKIKAITKLSDYDGNISTEEFEVGSSPFKYQVPYFYQSVELLFESNGIKSNSIKYNLESKPYNLSYSFSQNSATDHTTVPETTYITEYSNFLFFNGYGSNLSFKIDGNSKNYTYNSGNYSYLNTRFSINRDTTFYLNSATNSCGTTEFNKTIKVQKVETLINNLGEVSKKYGIANSECSGSEQIIAYEYIGNKPKKDSLVIQLAKYNSAEKLLPEKLKFYNVTTKQGINELTFTIPDSCFGSYVYRIRSVIGTHISNYTYLSFTVKTKPTIKLTSQSGKTEVFGSTYLYLRGNLNQVENLNVVLNNGENLSMSDFGVLLNTETNSNKNIVQVLYNNGRYFSPNQTTTYSIKSVYNSCGIGTVEGSVKVIISPTIIAKVRNSLSGNTYCRGDSLTLDLSYLEGISKDTLMGIYLHTDSKSTYNQELITFKNTPNSIKVKLPNDIYSGYYFIQIRKKSRSKSYFAGNVNPDSLSLVNARLSWDSDPVYLKIATPPNINLSGNPEIYAGNSVALNIQPINNTGQNIVISKDSIYLIYSMTHYYEFTDGSKLSSIGGKPIVSPLTTTTYSIASIKNYCGVGTSSGNSTVTVLNKSDKRIETLGFYRKYVSSPPQNATFYDYEYTNTFCSGRKDSLDIKLFTTEKNIEVSKYKVLLSDKDGLNFTPISTTKTKIITDSTNYKIIRLNFQLPDNIPFGFNYQIKGAAEDSNIPSAALTTPIKIYELPTATLTGNSQFIVGERVNALVKLTGDAPWSVSIVDKEGKFAYNGLPTKADSSENFKNYQPKLIYDKELKLELNPEKSTSYKVAKVTNKTCGLGKVVAGEFTVDLILAKENPIQNFIQIYPNPTADQLNIDLTSLNATTIIEIFNNSGKILESRTYTQSQTQQKQSLDFSQYHSGVYLIKVNTDKLSQTYRIVKH
ncbi:hypothetical protein GCM10027035_50080 [Emticicia sediminis]